MREAAIEPPQGDVIEKILRHCGLWHPSAPRPPPDGKVVVCVPDDEGDDQTGFFDEPAELTFVPDADWDRQPPEPRLFRQFPRVILKPERNHNSYHDAWVRKTTCELGLESTLRARGRPRKSQ